MWLHRKDSREANDHEFSNSWLSRVVSWLQQTERDPEDVQADEGPLEEHSNSVLKLELLYVAVQNLFREYNNVSRLFIIPVVFYRSHS